MNNDDASSEHFEEGTRTSIFSEKFSETLHSALTLTYGCED